MKRACIAILTALTLYVLSFGPAVRFAPRSPITGRAYAPLLWLTENSVLGRPIDWYLGLWIQVNHYEAKPN
jgi:hypothetical protein